MVRTRILIALIAVVGAGCYLQPGVDGRNSGAVALAHELTPANVAQLTDDWSVTWSEPVGGPLVSAAGVHVVHGYTLATLDLATGGLRWDHEFFPSDTQVPVGVGSPTALDDRVLVSTFVYRQPSATAAFNAATGAAQPTPSPGASGNELATRDQRIAAIDAILGGSGVGIIRLQVGNLADATKSYTADLSLSLSGPFPTTPAFGSDRLVYSSGESVQALPVQDPTCSHPPQAPTLTFCTPLWSGTTGGGTGLRPTITPDDATALIAVSTGRLVALSMADGTTQWSADLGSASTSTAASAATTATRAYVGTNDGRLHAVDPRGCGAPTCVELWHSAPLGGAITRQPTIAGDLVFVAAGSTLAAIDAHCDTDGCDALWDRDLGSPITGSPVVVGGRVLVSTQDGTLHTFTLPA